MTTLNVSHFANLVIRRSTIAIVLLCACGGGERSPGGQGARRVDAPAVGTPFPAGTVGHAVDGYYFDMTGVRRWYAALGDLGREVDRDTTFRFSLQMELNKPLAPYVAAIEANDRVRAAAARHGLTAREFALLTATMSAARMTRQLVDSLGPEGRPVNVGENLLTFVRANRLALDSLEASLGR